MPSGACHAADTKNNSGLHQLAESQSSGLKKAQDELVNKIPFISPTHVYTDPGETLGFTFDSQVSGSFQVNYEAADSGENTKPPNLLEMSMCFECMKTFVHQGPPIVYLLLVSALH